MCDYKTNKKNHLDRHIESHLKVILSRFPTGFDGLGFVSRSK